jgi:hypothetical protein
VARVDDRAQVPYEGADDDAMPLDADRVPCDELEREVV